MSARPVPAWSLPAGEAPRDRRAEAWRAIVTRDWAFGGSRGDGRRLRRRQRHRAATTRSSARSRAPSRSSARARTVVDRRGRARRRLRPRHRLRRDRPLARAGLPAPQRARARRRRDGRRRPDPRRAPPRDRGGARVISLSLSTTKRRFAEELHELADLAYFNRTILVASAHNLPVDSYPWRFSSVISVGSHEERDPLDLVREPDPAGRALRPRRRRRGRVAGRRHAPLHREQLRRAAHRGGRRARPREAPRADAVPAEERAPPDRGERGRPRSERQRATTERTRHAAAGDARRRRGDLPRAAAVDRRRRPRRSSAPRQPRSSSSTRKRTSSSSRRSRARARATLVGAALPVEHGDRGLRARHAPAARRRRPHGRIRASPATARRRPATSRRASSPRRSSTTSARSACSSVLDRAPDRPFGLAELELLSRFSTQAAIGLDLLLRARRAQAALGDDGSAALVAPRRRPARRRGR